MNSQNSQGSKSTSYNYFLKKNNQADKNLRRRNVSFVMLNTVLQISQIHMEFIEIFWIF